MFQQEGKGLFQILEAMGNRKGEMPEMQRFVEF